MDSIANTPTLEELQGDRSAPWLTAGLVASWLCFPLYPLGLLIEIPCLIVLLLRRSRLAALSILLSSSFIIGAFCFVSVSVSYWTGNARLSAGGLPGPTFYNLDRQTRSYWRNTGCAIWPWQLLTESVSNTTLRLHCGIFGPLRGTYHGTYPTPQAAISALQSHSYPVARGAWARGEITVGGQIVKIKGPANSKEFGRARGSLFRGFVPENATIYQGTCLILEDTGTPEQDFGGSSIALFDIATGRIFAYYLYLDDGSTLP
jgi:hypothetical protein